MLTIFWIIKPNFFLPNYRCFSSFFTYVHGLGSGKILSSHSFCFIFPYFSIGCPLSIFLLAPLHLSSTPIFSYPTSRSPSILAVRSPFLASFMFFHLSLPLSLLVCLHPVYWGGGGDIFNLVQPPSDKLHQSRTSHIII